MLKHRRIAQKLALSQNLSTRCHWQNNCANWMSIGREIDEISYFSFKTLIVGVELLLSLEWLIDKAMTEAGIAAHKNSIS